MTAGRRTQLGIALLALGFAAACSRVDRPFDANETQALRGVIYFVSEREGEPRAYRVHADGSGVAAVAREVGATYPYATSPDGSVLALVASSEDVDQIVLARPDGSNARVIA